MLRLIVFALLFNINCRKGMTVILPQSLDNLLNIRAQETQSSSPRPSTSTVKSFVINIPSDSEKIKRFEHAGIQRNNAQHNPEQSDINKIDSGHSKNSPNHAAIDVTLHQEKSNKSATLQPHVPQTNLKEDVQSGALLRGFYVFLGLSVVIMAYFVFKSYRLRHGSQPSTTIRKYGIVAQRSDIEMRPLELDDDDDDTIFEINNKNISH